MNTSSISHTCGAATFGKCDGADQRLFRINAGISAEQALGHASVLMASANKLSLMTALHEDDGGAMAWAAHYLGDMAKAIIDDLALGVLGQHSPVMESEWATSKHPQA